MKYANAVTVFPEKLLKEIQKYIKGGIIYIPSPEETHKKWGQNSGSRKYLDDRNEEIREGYLNGSSIDELSDTFCLSCHSIRKIIYSKR